MNKPEKISWYFLACIVVYVQCLCPVHKTKEL